MAQANPFNQEQVTTGLLSLVSWCGNATVAARALKAEGKLEIGADTLRRWARETHAEQYAELRSKYAEKLEADIVAEQRDVIRHALDVQRLGLEKAKARLESGADKDPSRAAANAATVADKMTRDMMTLQGRPTSIREDRSTEEVLRSLAAKGLIALPGDSEEEPKQLEGVANGVERRRDDNAGSL